jgi:hypothetical protein
MTQTTSSNIALIEYWNTNPRTRKRLQRSQGPGVKIRYADRRADACGSLDRFRPRRKPLVAARSIAVSAIAQLHYAANLGLAALMLDTHGRS